jgi:hypothetical protein
MSDTQLGQVTSGSTHRKKRFTSFPSPAGMSLTKLPLGRNNSVMTSLFPPRESLVVTSRLGTGNSRTFFLRCRGRMCGTTLPSNNDRTTPSYGYGMLYWSNPDPVSSINVSASMYRLSTTAAEAEPYPTGPRQLCVI